jgi:hypothetical protein
MRIQYWASKGNARIDSCLIKGIKGLVICSLKKMRDLIIWKEGGKDSDAVHDARLDHVFSEKRTQREVLFAKGLRYNSRILWQNDIRA